MEKEREREKHNEKKESVCVRRERWAHKESIRGLLGFLDHPEKNLNLK